MKRRNFIRNTSLMLGTTSGLDLTVFDRDGSIQGMPIVISTWNFGYEANKAAWQVLSTKGNALDAVEKGVMVAESDLNNTSVGRGGNPDRDGIVTLDACIMNQLGQAGSVAAIENIEHPISVARMVMEKTPHVMLAGNGAKQFALENGFESIDLLTDKSKANYQEWLKHSQYKPIINIENHDTIGMLALDSHGNLSGACTTSGLAFKMHGRVGDSPIIGAGLYVDGEVGAATATGVGEEMIRIAGSHTIVELMRQGRTPQEACEEAIKRVVKKHGEKARELQVAFLALSRGGEIGAYCTTNTFQYTITTADKNNLVVKAASYYP